MTLPLKRDRSQRAWRSAATCGEKPPTARGPGLAVLHGTDQSGGRACVHHRHLALFKVFNFDNTKCYLDAVNCAIFADRPGK